MTVRTRCLAPGVAERRSQPLGGERCVLEPTVCGGDVEHRADLAEAAERDAEVMEPVAAIAAVTLGEVEEHARDGVGALLGERGVVAAYDRERCLQAADDVKGEVVGEKAHRCWSLVSGSTARPRTRNEP